MYLYKNDQLPESFKNMFLTGEEIHNYNTRNKNFFRLPPCRTNVRKFSLRFQGPKIFNSINDKIKNSLNLKEFTSKLKSTFLDESPNACSCFCCCCAAFYLKCMVQL